MTLADNITVIKGIGEKSAQAFSRLGIFTVGDLINTFPRNYLTYGEPVDIRDTKIGERQAVRGTICSYVDVKQVRSLKLTTLTIKDTTGTVKAIWYNSPFLKNVFHKGETYIFVGMVKIKNNMRVMEMPEYYKAGTYNELCQELQPVYPLTKGLSNKTVQKAVMGAREVIFAIKDYLPEHILKSNSLMEITEAYENIHFPLNDTLLKNAIRRLAFDEFYKFLFDMERLKSENMRQRNPHVIVQGKAVADFVSGLPYRLTKGQAEAIDDILEDMGSDNVMNRLVQGDVGSGKTVVAASALLACVRGGYQGTLMVPTEVLARQHYRELGKLYEGEKIRIGCLTGSLGVREKRKIYEDVKEGNIDILIGTHAVIEDKVEFKNLALVITDEQHRFGVNQRRKLADKGTFPHVLVMSATPIPRTLAIIMYGDLDISVISQMPKGRLPIKNCVVGTEYRSIAYRFIADQVKLGNQTYVICPMIDEGDSLDVTSVTEYTDTLKNNLPARCRVAMLHGQMTPEKKNIIMEDFINGNIDVLVSTTVIEVGINNPNATVMMVENAERFGLAQLHQLRGRVGRGDKQSYCIFINGKESKESMERLKVLENSNDGFFIAGEDLKLRGPGDFFGIRQSGDMRFSIADIYNHADMLKLACDILKENKSAYPPGELPYVRNISKGIAL